MQDGQPPVRYWVEFPDPGRTDGAVVYRCDLTWLTSRWQCVFGTACPGIVASRPDDGCCTFGAHLTGTEDRDRVAAAASQLGPSDWQFWPGRDATDPMPWLSPDDSEPDSGQVAGESPAVGMTAVVDGACIFLNRPGFAGGRGCALHQLAARNGSSLVATKPEVCWQVPIRRSYDQVTGPDEVTRQVVGIGEFDRAAWGPGGHDLDWYCTREPVAHTAAAPLFVSARDELVELMGGPAYEELVRLAQDFLTGRAANLGVNPAR